MQVFQFAPDGVSDCHVTAWLQPELTEVAGRNHPAIVICPGGAYSFVSQREGAPVAKYYYAAGYSTFVLEYSVQEKAKDFMPLSQLGSTVAHIRRNAEQLHIDPRKVAVCNREVSSFDPYNARWVQWSIEWLNRIFDWTE